jgi:hypothetical protein
VAAGLTTGTGAQTVYTVPPGYVLICKSVYVSNGGLAAATGHFQITAIGVAQIPLNTWTLQPQETAEWNGWTVLNAGDLAQVISDQPSVYYWIAGALLSGFTGVPARDVPRPLPTEL